MKVLTGNAQAMLTLPISARRLQSKLFRNGEHGCDSLRRQTHARHVQGALLHAERRTQCAAAPPGQTSSKRSPASWPIKVKADQQPRSHLKLTVELPVAMVKQSYDGALAALKKSADLPGFRKGSKVPTDVLLRMMDGGAKKLKQSTVENLLQLSLPQALKKWDSVAINESMHIDSPIEDLVAVFDEKKPLTYQVGIDIAPTVSWKSPYQDIAVDVEAASSEESDRAAVARMLKSLRKEQGTLRVAVGRPLQMGDIVILDFDATRADEGEPILGAKRAGLRLDTETADLEFLPGLVDGLIGMSVGEERTVPVTFPDTWEPEQLRGVKANCTVKAKEIFDWSLPELTDEFVKKQIPSSSGLADAEVKLYEAQRLKMAEQTQQGVIAALSEAIADIVEADVPQSLITQMGEQEYQSHLLNMQQEGKINMEVIQTLANEKMLANYIDHKKEELDHMNRAVLGFEAIYQQEGLQLSEEQVQAEYESGVQGFKESGQEFDAKRLREQAVEAVRGMKVLEFLQSTCTINIKPYVGN